MAECQVLYGITMQRRGVSSRIAVSLDQVDELQQGDGAANGNGNAGGNGNGNDDAGNGRGRADDRTEPTARQPVAGEERVEF